MAGEWGAFTGALKSVAAAAAKRERVVLPKEDRKYLRKVYSSQLMQPDYDMAVYARLPPKGEEFRAFQREADMVYQVAKLGIHGHTINNWQKLQKRLAAEPYLSLPQIDTIPHVSVAFGHVASELLRIRSHVPARTWYELDRVAEVYANPYQTLHYDRADTAVDLIRVSNTVINGRPELAAMAGVNWYDHSLHNTMPAISSFIRVGSLLAYERRRPHNADELIVVDKCLQRIAYFGSGDYTVAQASD